MADKIIKEMNGHSGCKVFLCDKNGKKYVRKISSSKNYNNRLKLQMQKQNNFSDSVIKVPQTYKSGNIGDLFYFDMEFISGVSFHNYISLNSINNIIPIIEKISTFLQNTPVNNIDMTPDIQNKIHNLQKNIPSHMFKHCEYCLNYDWSNSPESQCHGDLTFENIFVYRNQVYFIDFLDSFVKTKYIDYSKLFQDIILMWSWRFDEKTPFIKNMYLYNKILDSLTDPEIEMIRRFLVLGLLRIVPYSNKKTLKILETNLQYISKRFGLPT